MTLEFLSKAKVNLYLHVVGKCKDYHHLDSIISFAEFGDKLIIEKAATDSIVVTNCSDKTVNGKGNILVKTLEFLRVILPNFPSGVKIHLHKNIPLESGFGGGSGNAAALIAAAITKWNLSINLQKWLVKHENSIVRKLGADVPACIVSHLGPYSCKIEKAGHIEKILPSKNIYHAILAKPAQGTCTSKSFSIDYKIERKKIFDDIKDNPVEFSKRMKNQLTRFSLETVKMEQLMSSANSCIMSRMSGSGSGCFGIFRNKNVRDSMLDKLKSKFLDGWFASTEIKI